MPVPEKYGSYATLVDSIGIRGVSTDTKLIFIGNSPTGELNVPVTITTLSEASTKLGITSTTNPTEYNLASAVFAAFNVAGLAEITCITVSNKKIGENGIDTDYLGNEAEGTGIYALEAMLRDNPTTTNLVCIPQDASVEKGVMSGLVAL